MKKIPLLILLCLSCALFSPTDATAPPPPAEPPVIASTLSPPLPTEEQLATEPPPAPGPTPDIRVFTDPPGNFLIEEEDLNGMYYIPEEPDWEGFSTNQDILDIRGEEAGQAYIEATGRVDGIFSCFHRVYDRATVPLELCVHIVSFETAQGASLAMTPAWDFYRVGEEIVITGYPPIGDESVALHYPPEIGDELVEYWLTFRVRNILVDITGYGLPENQDVNLLIGVGRKVVENTWDGMLSES
jgi:hypothetical protein